MTTAAEPKRPTAVLLISILAWLIGVIEIINGVQLIFAGEVGAFWQAGFDFFAGALAILVGIQMLRGDALARTVATVVFALVILAGILGLFLIEVGPPWVGGIVASVLALVGIILLWTRRSSEFFQNA